MVGYCRNGQAVGLKSEIYRRLCRHFGSFPLLVSIGGRILSQRLSRAASYYGFDPKEVAGCSVGLSITTFSVIGTILLSSFSTSFVHSLFGIFFSLSAALLTFYHTVNFLPNKLEAERITTTAYASAVLHEIYFILSSHGTLLDVLQAIGSSEYPFVSDNFRVMLYKSLNGEEPERLLRAYLRRQPSEVFRRGCEELLFTKNLDPGVSLTTLQLIDREAQGNFKKFLRQIEDRLSFLLALTFFIPFIVVLIALGQNLAWVELLIVGTPGYALATDVLYSSLLRSRARLIG